MPDFEFWRPGDLFWSPVRSALRRVRSSRSSSVSVEVVQAGFLPPTAGRSLIGGTSACSGPLLRLAAILWPSGWRLRSSASANQSRPGMGGRLFSPPPGEAGCGTSCTLDALCVGRNLFPVNPGSSRLSLVWWIQRAWAGLLLPRPLGAVGGLSNFSPADFSSLRLSLVERI